MTPEIFLKAIEDRRNYNQENNISLPMSAISLILQVVEENPKLKNNPAVQEKMAPLANLKVSQEPMEGSTDFAKFESLLKNPDQSEAQKINAAKQIAKTIRNYAPEQIQEHIDSILRLIHNHSEALNSFFLLEGCLDKLPKRNPDDLRKLESILVNTQQFPDQNKIVAKQFLTAFRELSTEDTQTHFNALFKILDRNSTLLGSNITNLILDMLLQKTENKSELFAQAIKAQSPLKTSQNLTYIISRALFFYQFNMLENLEKTLPAGEIKEQLQKMSPREKESVARLFGLRILQGRREFKSSEFEKLKEWGIEMDKPMGYETGDLAKYGIFTLNQILAERDLR